MLVNCHSEFLTETAAKPPEGVPSQRTSANWRPASLLNQLDGDYSLFEEVVRTFVQECPPKLHQIHQAIAAGDAAALTHVAHSLKGELGYLGVPELSDRAKRLEQMGHDGELQGAGPIAASLEKELLSIIQEMQSSLHDQTARQAAEKEQLQKHAEAAVVRV